MSALKNRMTYAYKGKVVRTSKTRKLEQEKPKAYTTFSEQGERTIHFVKERMKSVRWNGKTYKVPANIAG